MSLTPDQRRLHELDDAILAVLERIRKELQSLVILLSPADQKHESPASRSDITTKENGEPKPIAVIRSITQPDDAFAQQSKAEQKNTEAFQCRTLTVQWCLFAATFLAL